MSIVDLTFFSYIGESPTSIKFAGPKISLFLSLFMTFRLIPILHQ